MDRYTLLSRSQMSRHGDERVLLDDGGAGVRAEHLPGKCRGLASQCYLHPPGRTLAGDGAAVAVKEEDTNN